MLAPSTANQNSALALGATCGGRAVCILAQALSSPPCSDVAATRGLKGVCELSFGGNQSSGGNIKR
jgi:hypothetical protein